MATLPNSGNRVRRNVPTGMDVAGNGRTELEDAAPVPDRKG